MSINLNRIIKQKKVKKENKKNILKIITEMCMKSIQCGVCPHACEICAWNILRYEGGEK